MKIIKFNNFKNVFFIFYFEETNNSRGLLNDFVCKKKKVLFGEIY